MPINVWEINGQRLLNWYKEGKIIINHRTDNSIKNHFYSTIRRSLRRINKILGAKNSTDYMRTIKPAILSQICNNSEDKCSDSN